MKFAQLSPGGGGSMSFVRDEMEREGSKLCRLTALSREVHLTQTLY